MNKTELIDAIAKETGLSKKDSGAALEAITGTVSKALKKKDKVQLVGFGTFEVRDRKEREGRNPANGEPMTIPASRVPAFKAGKSLKEAVAR